MCYRVGGVIFRDWGTIVGGCRSLVGHPLKGWWGLDSFFVASAHMVKTVCPTTCSHHDVCATHVQSNRADGTGISKAGNRSKSFFSVSCWYHVLITVQKASKRSMKTRDKSREREREIGSRWSKSREYKKILRRAMGRPSITAMQSLWRASSTP